MADFYIKRHTTKQKPRKYYKFQKANWHKLKTDLDITVQTIQKQYNNNQSADDMWTYFQNSLQNSMDRHIPSASTKKHSRLPWINRPLLRLLRQKKRQYQKAKTTQDWTKYSSIKKSTANVKSGMQSGVITYINSAIQEGFDNNNTKPFWNFVKARRKDNVGVSPLKVNGRLFSNPENKAELLLKQFKSAFSSNNDNLPPIPKPLMHHLFNPSRFHLKV